MTFAGLPAESVLLFCLAILVGYVFLSGFIWGAGYYPTARKEIDSIAHLFGLEERKGAVAVVEPKFTLYDLGSGFGRVILSIAEKYRACCVGVEIDPIKCWWSRLAIERKGLRRDAKVIRSNILDVDLSSADAVFVFLSEETNIMERLRQKLFREMRPGSRVVSYIHRFPGGWAPEQTSGKLSLYIIPSASSNEVESGADRTDA
jgi:SAM-dependent methyltransferase